MKKVRQSGMQRRWHAGQLNMHKTPGVEKEKDAICTAGKPSRVEGNVPTNGLAGFQICQYMAGHQNIESGNSSEEEINNRNKY
jgi:hypothetical protein